MLPPREKTQPHFPCVPWYLMEVHRKVVDTKHLTQLLEDMVKGPLKENKKSLVLSDLLTKEEDAIGYR